MYYQNQIRKTSVEVHRVSGNLSRRLPVAYADALRTHGSNAVDKRLRWNGGRLRAQHVSDDTRSGHSLCQ